MRRLIKLIIIINICLLMFIGCIQKRTPKPPVAKKIIKMHELHGITWEDDYDWLKEREADDVLSYLKDENKYTESMTEYLKDFQDTIYNEMIAKIVETDLSVPEKDGDYYYYSKKEQGKDYTIWCRKKGSLDSDEEIILDENELAKDYDFYSVDLIEVSPNGNMLAFAVDTTGREEYTIHFKDLKKDKILLDKIEHCFASMVWAEDNKTVFYTVMDETLRPYRVYRHKLESKTEDDIIFEEEDGRFWVSLSASISKKYLFIEASSALTTEVWYNRSNKPQDDFKLFQKRVTEIEYSVYHHDKEFFIITNDTAKNFKLMITPENRTDKKNWKDYIAYDPQVKIDGLDMFEDYIALYERKDGSEQIRIINLKDKSSGYVDFGEEVYTFTPGGNKEYDSKTLRFKFSSPLTPNTIIDYDMEMKSKKILKVDEIKNYDKSMYVTKRVFAPAPDGVKIPVSLVYKNGLELNGNNPVYLYGYGAYGISTEARFRPHSFPLLDRGVVFAIAHVRGGGEMGRTWYEDGKFLKKKNTFTDFIAVTEFLISEKYTKPELIGAGGGSAGGLLIGAVANMRPDLYKIMVADVPFVDVINTMLDPSIPLTVMEYEEWGNPNEKEYFDYMRSYSPYDNVSAQDYPMMLILAGLNDPRVQYFEPAKWTAKLRATKTDSNLLLLRTNMGAGHMGSSKRYQFYDEIAFEYAIVLDKLGARK